MNLLPFLLLLPLQSGGLEEALAEAESLAAKNDLQGAVSALEDAGVTKSGNAEAMAAYGNYRMRLLEARIAAGQVRGLDAVDGWADVADVLEAACALPGAPAAAFVDRAEALLNGGDEGAALETLDGALATYPNSAPLHMQRGRVLMALARKADGIGDEEARNARSAEAEGAFKSAMKAAPKSAAPAERLGELLWTLWFQGGNSDDALKQRAIDAWGQAADRDPHGIDLGNLNAWLGAESVPVLDRVAAERPDDAVVYWYRGMAHHAAGPESWEALRADFERVLELNPQFTNAYFFLADGAMKRGVWQASVQGDTDKAATDYRASAQYWAMYLKDFGNDYRRSLAQEADGGRAVAENMNYLAGQLVVRGLFIPQEYRQVGVTLLDWATRTVPDFADAWQNLGFFCREAGEYPRARDAYRRAHELLPDDPQIMNDYAVIYHFYLKSDDDAAEDLYRRAIARAEAMLEAGEVPEDDLGRIRTALRDARSNLQKLLAGDRDNG